VLEHLLKKKKDSNLQIDQDIKTTKDFYELTFTPNTKKESKFPFKCGVTDIECNGHGKFVFGTESKVLVSEKALKEINPNLASCKDKINKNEVGDLDKIYDEGNEDKLVCPVTNKKFGRPILLYPITPAELTRAIQFQQATSKKRKHKKSKKNKDDCSDPKIPKQNRAVSSIASGSVKDITGEITGDMEKSKELENYRKLNLIGDTRNEGLKDESATAKLFNYTRPYFK